MHHRLLGKFPTRIAIVLATGAIAFVAHFGRRAHYHSSLDLDYIVWRKQKQGPDLIDLRRAFGGVIFQDFD